MQEKLYAKLAQLVGAYRRCTGDRLEWADRHETRIKQLIANHMPSGAGFDMGPGFDLDASTEEKLVFHTHFHHMNDVGFYDGWTDHTVTVKPSLAFGFKLTVSGPNRRDIKDYVHDCFYESLCELVGDEPAQVASV